MRLLLWKPLLSLPVTVLQLKLTLIATSILAAFDHLLLAHRKPYLADLLETILLDQRGITLLMTMLVLVLLLLLSLNKQVHVRLELLYSRTLLLQRLQILLPRISHLDDLYVLQANVNQANMTYHGALSAPHLSTKKIHPSAYAEATPAVPNEYLTNEGCIDRATPENIPTIRKYQTLVGALLYLSGWSRPDIAAAVSSCSRFLAGPSPAHITAAKRILRYLAGTSDLCICYRRSPATNPYINTLFGYCDADHAGAPDDRLSVTGFMYFMNGGPISWCSKRQPIVALSSTEAEFYAASQAGNAAIVLRRLLEAMGIPQQGPTVVMEDNAACIFMAHRPGELKRAKHIDTRIYRLREMTRDGIILLAKVLTEFQVADIFTKALPTILFERHRSTFLSR